MFRGRRVTSRVTLRNVFAECFLLVRCNRRRRHDEIAVQGGPHRLQRAAARGPQVVRLAARLCAVAHREKVPVARGARRLRVRPEVCANITLHRVHIPHEHGVRRGDRFIVKCLALRRSQSYNDR